MTRPTLAPHQLPTCRSCSFHEGLPQLIGAMDVPGFLANVDTLLHRLVPFDQSCVFLYPRNRLPRLLHDNLQGISEPGVMERYLTGTYLLDPVHSACESRMNAGLYRMEDLAPDAFFQGEYFNSPEVHPCISLSSGSLCEEIVFLSPLANDTYAAYSLIRANGSMAFSVEDMALLQRCQPILEALFQQHYRLTLPSANAWPKAPGILDHLGAALSRFATGCLTPREQDIVGYILKGHSSLSIALHLEIAEGTVKNHRKSLYRKLGISSQSELFHLFVNQLLQERP
ncbi:helix-turn-helix domain-containing protein [Pseudomonas guariconensis]|uniref:helix-turn-helix domain-containing protein n=1 Tax=Pseudomonas guariconensis TaxID=1288410 RepID=UPI0018AC3526|nr:helix-turn-helix transcriptional regulator [Pseudomonas guariconensis]MBF8741840.1 helix-turn-helix transcriptional regulator [Pseudomonas guariconensis]MBF8750705.1 helix-turn-helix transcriptional regulator [Pseudomonas guariconensis]